MGNLNAAGASLQNETLIYATNIAKNSGTISSSDLTAVDKFVTSAKANNYWTNLLDMSPLAGNQTNAAVVKLVIGLNSPTNLAINGLVAANYTRTNGWNNPANAWLDTVFTNTPITNQGMAVWITLPNTNFQSQERPIGHTSAPGGDACDLQFSGTPITFSGDSLSGSIAAPNNQWNFSSGVGLCGYTRTANNLAYTYQNGAVVWTRTTADTSTANNQPVTVLGAYHYYASGVPSSFSYIDKPIGFYAVDNGIPTNLLSAYYSDVRTLMRAIGRTGQYPFSQPTYLIIGQSLAAAGGNGTGTVITGTNGNSHVLYHGGQELQAGFGSVFTPRVTRSTFFSSGGETGWRAFGDHLNYLFTNNGYGSLSNSALLLNWAESGKAYSVLQKGSTNTETINGITTNVYQFSISDIQAQHSIQSNLYGFGINVQSIPMCHGEADIGVSVYSNNLATWSHDLQQDITAATGQTNLPPILMMQSADINWPTNGGAYPYAPLAMLTAHEVSAGSNILVGSRYMMKHAPDGVHLYNTNYCWQGEYFAEAEYSRKVKGYFEPVRPLTVTRSVATITVTVTNMTGTGLVIDTNLVNACPNFGFTYTNADISIPTISSVVLAGSTTNQITITLSTPPLSAGLLRYAMNSTNVNLTGPVSGSRGNIRDGYSGLGFITTSNMYNWCVMFEKAVP